MASSSAIQSSANELANAVRDASFPESEEILSSSISAQNIPPLLDALNTARNELSETIRTVSRKEAGDVDGWIEQAKRVQADIVRCKQDAHQIIQEHQRIEALRDTLDEARNKSQLLESELAFNETLERQILMISEISAILAKVDNNIGQHQLLIAAQTLPSITSTINKVPGSQSRLLLLRTHSNLEQRLKRDLQRNLDERVLVSTTDDGLSLQLLQDAPGKHGLPETDTHTEDFKELSLNQILESMTLLDLRDHAIVYISQRMDAILLPYLYRKSKLKISSASATGNLLFVRLSSDVSTTIPTVVACFEITKYLHNLCPSIIREDLMQKVLSLVLPLLVNEWLNPAVPTELDHATGLDELQKVIENFDTWLKENGYGHIKELDLWVKEIPRTWFSKRRTLALDAVRTAFKKATGSTRLVDRVERQTANVQEQQLESGEDDWADNWEDDDDQKHAEVAKKFDGKSDADDGSDAWGFDADEHVDDASLPSNTAVPTDVAHDDEGEAWGWGDEDDPHAREAPAKALVSNDPNGLQSRVEPSDIVLKETYSVTDIPDYIIDQISRDLADGHRLHESPSTYFKSAVTTLPDLGSLPTLTLAMFRATATTSYQSEFSPSLSSMQLYNDVLYLASRLTDDSSASSKAPPVIQSTLSSQKPILEKFARQVYTSEITTHRTVLLDLLDTAQGFISCTRSPYTETCETAVTSTTEYLRSVYSQWSPILSQSHLYQSIGNLLNSIMRKIIEDIEDMEDISEPESRKLLTLCEPVSALQDLFVAEGPASGQVEGPVSMIAVHCASYLRFQYLQQILESNLVEIKYLWTDAGLSLEFRAEEVVDLIQALFTESPQRRSAINTIKSGA